ncbi:MAG: hypothetical protein JSW41_06045 [Candidatus Aenigmatarchaeota archaeon]|nr:MAG: hypothetical protein JSW41_06045 [Candidatus Aenigmarchaeota archaeon]
MEKKWIDEKSVETLEFVRLFEYIKSVSKIIGEKKAWEILKNNILERRIRWLEGNKDKIDPTLSELEKLRQVLILKLGAKPEELGVSKKDSDKIIIRSNNFCPILTACKILEWDPKRICKIVCEGAAREFLLKVNPGVGFKFTKTRPHSKYCEEVIKLL